MIGKVPALLLLLILVLCAGISHADIIKLRTGETYEGKVKMGGGAFCEVTLRDGKVVRIDRTNIESIEEGPCSWELYAEKASVCDYSDAKAIMALVEFCCGKGLWEEWRQNLEKVLEIEPDHKDARFLLDYKKKDDKWILKDLSDGEWSAEEYLRAGYTYDKRKRKWLSPDETKRAAGFILFRGEWKTKTEVKKLLADEEADAQRIMASKTADELAQDAWDAATQEKALRLIQLAIRKEPRSPLHYSSYAGLLIERYGDTLMAERVIREAKDKKIYDYRMRGVDARLSLYRCDFKNADRLARSVIAEKPGLWSSYFTCGTANYYMGNLEEAAKTLRKYVTDSIGRGGSRTNSGATRLCTALRLLGRTQEAEDIYTEEFGGNINCPEYSIEFSALTKSKEEVYFELRKYFQENSTVEMRDIRRSWLKFDPAFHKFRGDKEFERIIAPEGADTGDWSANEVDSEDISGKDIRKAGKNKKRTIDTTGLVGRWGVLKADSYFIFTNAPRPRVVEIGNRVEKLAQIVDNILSSEVKKGSEPILKVFRLKAEYTKYMSNYYRAPSRMAYYIPPTEEVVTWAPDISALDSVMSDTYAACVEQRLYADLGVPLPVWLTEGMRFYFSTARYDSKEFRFESGAPNATYLSTFKGSHPDPARAPDLAFFLTQTRLGLEKTGDSGQAGRADLWGFVYFLLKSPDENVKKILPAYFTALRGKKEQKEALEVLYANIDRQTLSEMMVEFINSL